MKKITSKILCAGLSAVMICSSAIPVFAAEKTVNSTGSVANDYITETNGKDPGEATEKTEGIIGYDDTQNVESQWKQYSDFMQENKQYSADVYASQASGEDYYNPDGELIEGDIIVWLPTSLVLNGTSKLNEYKAEYGVKVKGNIAGNELVSVIPDKNVSLRQQGKEDVTASIAQEKQEFTYSDLKDGATSTSTGTVTANSLSAGSWNGAFNFTVSLKNN